MKYSDICKVFNIKIEEANSFMSRLKGLMFKKKKIDYGLLLRNTNGIHTFFMFQSIDVVLLDKDFNVIYSISDVKPWRVILPKKHVKHTLELPSGTISKGQ